jgi:hypothetical protein
MPVISFGKVITEEGYRDGKLTTSIRREVLSVPIKEQKQLWDVILKQLDGADDCTEFKVYRHKKSHVVVRVEIINESMA